jgi:hypothetical protein
VIANPTTGVWYVRVTGVKTFANVQLLASYTTH